MRNESAPVHGREFSLVGGGLLYRFLASARLVRPDPAPVCGRAVFLALLTWLPLLVLSAMRGLAWGGAVQVPFLYDFTTSARLLLALPILIAVEKIVETRSGEAARHFIESGLIAGDEVPKFQSILRQVRGMVDSVAAEVVIAALVIINSVFLHFEFSGTTSTWQFMASASGTVRTAAGMWQAMVSMPVFQFLLVRWLYRYLAWCWFLLRVSRLNLRLIPTHPDRAGGLAFLGENQVMFGAILFALASILSAHIGQEIIFGGAVLKQYAMVIAANVLGILFVFLAPLLVFFGPMADARRKGLLAYGALAQNYTLAFDRKWIGGGAPAGEPLLGSADIQSLADMANSFSVVQGMRLVPIEFRASVLPMAATTLIPFSPLALTVYPFDDLIKTILKVLL